MKSDNRDKHRYYNAASHDKKMDWSTIEDEKFLKMVDDKYFNKLENDD